MLVSKGEDKKNKKNREKGSGLWGRGHEFYNITIVLFTNNIISFLDLVC